MRRSGPTWAEVKTKLLFLVGAPRFAAYVGIRARFVGDDESFGARALIGSRLQRRSR